jgi:predicted transcriptional regulator of viral defense system
MPPTRLQLAKTELTTLFDQTGRAVFSRQDLTALLAHNRNSLRLARSTTLQDFLHFLTRHTKLKGVVLRSKDYVLPARYTWGEVSPYLLALSFKKAGYLSHATALHLHGLAARPSNTVYVNFEQSAKRHTGQLSQESIDRAFANRQRRTNYVFAYRDAQIAILSGKQTGRLGVTKKEMSGGDIVDATNIERTLIDIAVRPDYSGGVQEVLDAYRLARPAMSVDGLLTILKALKHIYPYHQAIGFYLQHAGYEKPIWERMKQFEFKYDFYLAHRMDDKVYNTEWRLFHPKGLA